MLRVPIEQAKEGMTLARSVPNPKKPQNSLLKANFKLDEETIKRLRTLRIYSLWVQYPNLDFLDEILDPELTRNQQELYGALKDQFQAGQEISLAKVDYSRYVQQVGQLFSRILTGQGKSSLFINELHGESNDIFLHGTTVAYLALLIGMRLENYLVHERHRLPVHLATDLTQLGVGCLLHDIGKLNFPEELQNFRLTAQDRGEPEWQKHTEAGFEMVQGLQAIVVGVRRDDGGEMAARGLQVVIVALHAEVGEPKCLFPANDPERGTYSNGPQRAELPDDLAPVLDFLIRRGVAAVDDPEGFGPIGGGGAGGF